MLEPLDLATWKEYFLTVATASGPAMRPAAAPDARRASDEGRAHRREE
jgi:hypothetical protein